MGSPRLGDAGSPHGSARWGLPTARGPGGRTFPPCLPATHSPPGPRAALLFPLLPAAARPMSSTDWRCLYGRHSARPNHCNGGRTMRKITASLFISLDGVVDEPHQWHFPWFNEEMGAVVAAQMSAADTMLLGRKSYGGFAEAWQEREAAGGEDA